MGVAMRIPGKPAARRTAILDSGGGVRDSQGIMIHLPESKTVDLPPPVDLLQEAGLSLLGVSRAESSSDRALFYQSWLEQGCHGTMDWLERHASLKYQPSGLLEDCRSILVMGLPYYQEAAPAKGEGRVARYAWGRDYHKTLGKRLDKAVKALHRRFPTAAFRAFTDTAPLDERYYAEQAGVGFMGRNTLIIHPTFGSWFVIGEILSSVRWAARSGTDGAGVAGCPAKCSRCLRHCPTGALTGPGMLDARRCISYLTIEYKGSIAPELRPLMEDWIFGCDRCQEVCPLSLHKPCSEETDFLNWRAGPGISLADVLMMEEAVFRTRFAGTPIMRTGLRFLKRNACVAAGNTGDPAALSALIPLASGSDDLLAEHAAWALSRAGRTTQ